MPEVENQNLAEDGANPTTGTLNGLVGRNIDDFAKTWKLQRQYLWEFLLPDIAGINGMEISKFCQGVKFGEYNMGEVSRIRYGAFKKGYAGFFELDTVSAEFLKPVPDIVTEYFQSWKRLIIDDKGFYYPKQTYAKTCYVRMYDRDGAVSGNYRLTGMFPKTFPAHELSYTTEELVKFTIEFNVDMVYTE